MLEWGRQDPRILSCLMDACFTGDARTQHNEIEGCFRWCCFYCFCCCCCYTLVVMGPQGPQEIECMEIIVYFTGDARPHKVLLQFFMLLLLLLWFVKTLSLKAYRWIETFVFVPHSTILHEVIHALGVHHTQTRFDRDQFIQVHFDRINPKYTSNFRVIPKSKSFGTDLPYDYLR